MTKTKAKRKKPAKMQKRYYSKPWGDRSDYLAHRAKSTTLHVHKSDVLPGLCYHWAKIGRRVIRTLNSAQMREEAAKQGFLGISLDYQEEKRKPSKAVVISLKTAANAQPQKGKADAINACSIAEPQGPISN